MKIECTTDSWEKIDVVNEGDSVTGSFTCTANGEVNVIKSALSLSTHTNLKFTKEYDVEAGTLRKHLIKIAHTRPVFLADLRPQKYPVIVDGNLAAEHEGY